MAQVGCDKGLICSRDGIFKLLQFALSLLILIIISTTSYWVYSAMQPVGFVQFTGAFTSVALLISLIIYIFKLYNIPLISKLPWKLLEIGFAVLCAILYFISMAISAWAVEMHYAKRGNYATSAVVSAFVMVIFIVYAVLLIRSGEVRSEKPPRSETSVNT